jgi:3'(2'), 5'-bisphosphate nucleotidase
MSHDSDLELARSLADEAGRLLLSMREGFDADAATREQAKDLRDRADRAAHELLAGRIGADRPDDALLSEEGVDGSARLGSQRVWIVDPLDGTWEYGQGRSDFAVHVALWEAGSLVAGAVALPARGDVLDTGSVAPVADAAPGAQQPLRLVVSRTRPPAALDALVPALAARLGVEVESYSVGSAGVKAVEVVEGRADAYLHDSGLSEWDVAAPAAVAAAAGLRVSDLSGAALAYNRMPPLVGELLIARPVVADALVAALAALDG